MGGKQSHPSRSNLVVLTVSDCNRVHAQDNVDVVARHRIGVQAVREDIDQFQQALFYPAAARLERLSGDPIETA